MTTKQPHAGAPVPQEDAPPPTTAPTRGRNVHQNRILVGVAILLLLSLGTAGYWYFFMRGIVFTDDARLSGHLVDASPEINGRLMEVFVHEGDSIKSGQNLFRLDSETAEATLNQMEAALVSAKANAVATEAMYLKALNGTRPEEIKSAEALVRRLQSDESLAKLELTRVQELRKSDAVPQDRLDRAQAIFESAYQSRESAAQNLVLLQQGPRKEDIDAVKAETELARARVSEATATVEKARKDLTRYVVKAPFDGWVVRRWVDPGVMLSPGQPVASLFDPATMRVDANIEEKDLEDVQIGDVADLTVDAYPHLRLTGRIMEILRATNSKFSLVPAEGVAGTYIKVAQRIPLRVSIEAPTDLPLGPGLSVEVHIRSGSSGKERR